MSFSGPQFCHPSERFFNNHPERHSWMLSSFRLPHLCHPTLRIHTEHNPLTFHLLTLTPLPPSPGSALYIFPNQEYINVAHFFKCPTSPAPLGPTIYIHPTYTQENKLLDTVGIPVGAIYVLISSFREKNSFYVPFMTGSRLVLEGLNPPVLSNSIPHQSPYPT